MDIQKTKSDSYTGIYRGVVLDNNDPSQYGRIKVNVHGVFDGIDSTNLPWAVPASSIFVGSGSDQGCFCVPDVGTYVFVFFESGDMWQPVYFAGALDGVHGLPSERTTNYPNNRVFKTSNGIIIEINDSVPSITVTHPDGATVTIGTNGDVTISSTGTITLSGSKVEINP